MKTNKYLEIGKTLYHTEFKWNLCLLSGWTSDLTDDGVVYVLFGEDTEEMIQRCRLRFCPRIAARPKDGCPHPAFAFHLSNRIELRRFQRVCAVAAEKYEEECDREAQEYYDTYREYDYGYGVELPL